MRKIVVEVHNDSVFVCILGENGDKIQEKFGILTSKLDKFRNRRSCNNKVPESIGYLFGEFMKIIFH